MKTIMIVGTTSHAGKSFLTAAICRILARQGCKVTPFKGQNMALNAYVTKDEKEIGYAQAVQAWAAKIEPRVEINPILLKPQGNMTSQVILNGEVIGTTSAGDYYQNYFKIGWKAIKTSLEILKSEFDFCICEGAGNPAEINLKYRDLTNMRVAKYLHARTILIVDIDRGGAFAHIIGTLQLLDKAERSLIKGIIINKFRGQRLLLNSGIKWLESYTKIPVLGVIPLTDIVFSAEDSLDLLNRNLEKSSKDINITVVRLPHIANFTDFEPLKYENTINVEYINLNQDIGNPDVLIIPGSKTTINDLIALHKSGMTIRIKEYFKEGGVILGICGGFQMLGETIVDSDKIEGEHEICLGLNLLPMETKITSKKTTLRREVISNYPHEGHNVKGYEIHQGVTNFLKDSDIVKNKQLHYLFDDPTLGVVNKNLSMWGCYLHGIFENGMWRRMWLNSLRRRKKLPPLSIKVEDYVKQREKALDDIADLVESFIDLAPLLK
ncbi:cobyric acid synthase CobQ [Candidatus Atelocyanobacterium thalassae]|uniref:Cobyric acid synthase n=1 Tax=cyanobacterium endosymbiont of Braarudosphaera bigelowii TaxID=1285375 RepID=A0ABM7U638_9CHRO|nr:cobyric acid synthase CobQ [Candidatus Atelocyanobacterium thalassa]BDA40192.1 cobyric acid synthase [cyanobacterium endosymbiont of Braarudosphaera bigelowii]